jgi:hypothetical protein
VLAEANTSAGAPELIWVARAELAAKLNVTFVPGFAASNCFPSSVNDSVSEAAANTVMSPDIVDVVVPLALGVEPDPELALLSVLDPHPASPSASSAEAESTTMVRRIKTPS